MAKPSGGSKRKAADNLEFPPAKHRLVASSPAPTTHVHQICKISRSAVNAVPSRKTKQAFEDTHVQEVSEDNDAVEDEDEEQSDVPLQKDDTDSDSPPVPAATVVDVRTPSPETTS